MQTGARAILFPEAAPSCVRTRYAPAVRNLYAIVDVKSGATLDWRATRDEAEAVVDSTCRGCEERAEEQPQLQIAAVTVGPARPPKR